MIGIIEANTDDLIRIGYRWPQFNGCGLKYSWGSGTSVKCLTSLLEDLIYGRGSSSEQVSGRRSRVLLPDGRDIYHVALMFHTCTPTSIRVIVYPITH